MQRLRVWFLRASPSSEIQDPSRERAAGTSHSQDTGTTVADLVWPPGGEGRTPPTTRYSASQQVSIHEVRHRPVFVSSLLRARSLLDPPFWIICQCFRVTSITLDPARVKIRVGQKFTVEKFLIGEFFIGPWWEFGDLEEEIEGSSLPGWLCFKREIMIIDC